MKAFQEANYLRFEFGTAITLTIHPTDDVVFSTGNAWRIDEDDKDCDEQVSALVACLANNNELEEVFLHANFASLKWTSTKTVSPVIQNVLDLLSEKSSITNIHLRGFDLMDKASANAILIFLESLPSLSTVKFKYCSISRQSFQDRFENNIGDLRCNNSRTMDYECNEVRRERLTCS